VTSSAPIIPVFASGDIIESAWANDLRTYLLLLDGRTGGDPGSTGLILGSLSALLGGWNTVINWLGFTPVNKAGDTGIGALTASALASTGDIGATGTVSAATFNGGSTTTGAVSALGIAAGTSGISSTGTIVGVNETLSGALSVTGNVGAGTYSGGTTASGSVSAQGLAAGTSGISTAGQISSSLAIGTAPISVTSTTVCPNLHATNSDQLGGVVASSYARKGASTYVGNGGAQNVALGISANVVVGAQATDTSNGVMFIAFPGFTVAANKLSNVTNLVVDTAHGISGTDLQANTGAANNTGGVTYTYEAFT